MESQSRPQQKSINSLAFEHYLRTGQRFTAAEFAERLQKKYNHNHDELGRFASEPGFGGGARSGSSVANFTARPRIPTHPKAPGHMRSTSTSEPIPEVPGFSQKGETNWRSSIDSSFVIAAMIYNNKYRLKPSDPGYRTPEFLKAWAMIESGGEGNKAAFLSDPFQVNNPGDWAAEKTKFGLREGQKMTPDASALAALEWLRHKAAIQDRNRRIIGYQNDRQALEDYNGHHAPTRRSGNLPNHKWYAATILTLSSQMLGRSK